MKVRTQPQGRRFSLASIEKVERAASPGSPKTPRGGRRSRAKTGYRGLCGCGRISFNHRRRWASVAPDPVKVGQRTWQVGRGRSCFCSTA